MYLCINLNQIKMSNKKIIGYKAPYYLFNGQVKKGDLYIDSNYGTYHHKIANYYHIPKEIVETWEPVYESPEIIVSMGEFNVKVTPDGIFHKSENITIFVKILVDEYNYVPFKKYDGYTVIRKDIIFSQTGCEHSETKLSQWTEVWNMYQKLK